MENINYLVVISDDIMNFVAECDLRVQEGFLPAGGITVFNDTYYQSFFRIKD